jgi:hypothetical protein
MRREIDQKRGLPLGVRTSPDEGLTLHKV